MREQWISKICNLYNITSVLSIRPMARQDCKGSWRYVAQGNGKCVNPFKFLKIIVCDSYNGGEMPQKWQKLKMKNIRIKKIEKIEYDMRWAIKFASSVSQPLYCSPRESPICTSCDCLSATTFLQFSPWHLQAY